MTVGQIVKFRYVSGLDEMPAIITRVWSDFLVNLTAFPDGQMPQTHSSVSRATLPDQGYTFREIA